MLLKKQHSLKLEPKSVNLYV